MLRPRDEADLAEIIVGTACALEPVAGGSLRSIGKPVDAEVLDLSALEGILAYEPDELVLCARAATPLATIEQTLRERRQRLAFEPPDWAPLLASTARPTIGGVLAANASGSRRLTGGAARDHFLGFRAVSGRGERFKGGGRVVKNVTGYDLPKLLAGSWGTLAVLTEVFVRVVPAPEHERTLLLQSEGPATAVIAMTSALDSQCEVSAAAFLPRRGVALRLEGFAASVAARAAALLERLGRPDGTWLEQAESRAFWVAVGAVQPLHAHSIIWRMSVPPSDAAAIIEQLAPLDYLLDWGGGLIWIACEEPDAPRVRGALRRGHATLIKAPPAARAATAVFQPLAAPLAAAASRLKAAFDPAGRLNPGRMG
ncbi:MAG TPA: FAD-binding protein [Steroidobacteraceae bacterium]|nr:FAD-binding protein [Steroidobacteraceae bacterium]